MDAQGADILRNRLMKEEGVRLVAYYDSLGYPTQGVGRKLSSTHEPLDRFPDIGMCVAMNWLDEDIEMAEAGLRVALPWMADLDAVRQGVLVDMAFQLGCGGVMNFPHALTACHAGDYATAAEQMRASKWDTETPGRCERLAEIMRTGKP